MQYTEIVLAYFGFSFFTCHSIIASFDKPRYRHLLADSYLQQEIHVYAVLVLLLMECLEGP
jgi:hypothetical protein